MALSITKQALCMYEAFENAGAEGLGLSGLVESMKIIALKDFGDAAFVNARPLVQVMREESDQGNIAYVGPEAIIGRWTITDKGRELREFLETRFVTDADRIPNSSQVRFLSTPVSAL